MPWKLKLDEDGKPVMDGENPVYIKPDGTETTQDVEKLAEKIGQLNGEAKNHREKRQEAEDKLKEFTGVDLEAAKKAIETVKKLDDKELIDAGKVDEVRAEITKQYEGKLAEKDETNKQLQGRLDSTMIGYAFANSKYIADKIAVPGDMIKSTFGSQFKVTDNGIRAVDGNGNEIMSKQNIGEPASFDEALEIIIGGYANKDQILKGSGSQGSGSQGSGGTGPNGKAVYNRHEFNQKTPAEQAAISQKVREGKAELVDN